MVANTTDHPPSTPSRHCTLCGNPISPARLEVLPDTPYCIKCARTQPPPRVDVEKLDLSQASPITRNGFAPKD